MLLIGAVALAAAAAVGYRAAVDPITTTAVMAVAAAFALCLRRARQLPVVFLGVLGALLVVYALLGKGGAYLNVGGVYVGELVLAFGILAVLLGGMSPSVFRSTLTWGILAFGACGALQTIPYIPVYGLDALRDAVTWAYGVFALLVAGFLVRTGMLRRVPAHYARWFVWWLPFGVIAVWAIQRYAEPLLPFVPGTRVPILNFKSGDAVFHLTGVAAFVLLGLRHRSATPARLGRLGSDEHGPGWLWWGGWLAATAIVLASSRATFLALAAAATVFLLRPTGRVWRPVLLTIIMTLLFFSSDIEIEVRDGRMLSPQEMLANVTSVLDNAAPGNRDATKEWRLQWWRDIVGYTVFGEYFWTGKGFGLNIAVDDGYASGDGLYPLRSPHNGHLTILARSGVPGMLIWIVLQVGFAVALVRGYWRLRHVDDWWARVHLWVLACWMAFIVNAAFEVTIEGPHGGIWFWSLFGFGIAVLEARRGVGSVGRRAVPRPGAATPATRLATGAARARTARVG